MARERFAEEFKSEAARQVIERGYIVADVAKRLGVSAQSLYKWVRASSPSDQEKDKAELVEVRRENLRLRAELARAQEERDILKKAVVSSTLQGSPSKVCIYRSLEGAPWCCCAGCTSQWLLCMEAQA